MGVRHELRLPQQERSRHNSLQEQQSWQGPCKRDGQETYFVRLMQNQNRLFKLKLDEQNTHIFEYQIKYFQTIF